MRRWRAIAPGATAFAPCGSVIASSWRRWRVVARRFRPLRRSIAGSSACAISCGRSSSWARRRRGPAPGCWREGNGSRRRSSRRRSRREGNGPRSSTAPRRWWPKVPTTTPFPTSPRAGRSSRRDWRRSGVRFRSSPGSSARTRRATSGSSAAAGRTPRRRHSEPPWLPRGSRYGPMSTVSRPPTRGASRPPGFCPGSPTTKSSAWPATGRRCCTGRRWRRREPPVSRSWCATPSAPGRPARGSARNPRCPLLSPPLLC